MQSWSFSGLSREQLAFFVQHGYLVLKPTVPGGTEFHNAAFEGACQLDAEDELGNNCLPLLPQLQALVRSPELRGALTALLGEDYVLMPHRHCHVQDKGSPGQPFHRDSYFSFEQFRHCLPVEVMVNYYPQRVLPEMGPTALLPGSQYHRGTCFRGAMEFRPDRWGDALEERRMTTDEAGVCVLTHYHLWHRATGRNSSGPLPQLPPRWMFKLQFRRVRPFRGEGRPPSSLAGCARANPYASFCSGSSSTCDLPVPLQGVKPGAEAAWIEQHATIWAAVWAALTGEPLEGEARRAQERPTEPSAMLESEASAVDVSTSGNDCDAAPPEPVVCTDEPTITGEGSLFDVPLAALGSQLSAEEIPLYRRFEAVHAIALGAARTSWPTEALVGTLLPVMARGHQQHEDAPPRSAQTPEQHGEDAAQDASAEAGEAGAGRWGRSEALALRSWLGFRPEPSPHRPARDPRWSTAAALQCVNTPLPPRHPDGAALRELAARALAGDAPDVEASLGDWRLELLLALAAALPAEEAVASLAPALGLSGRPRVQLHASMALYAAGVRCGAPEHGGWRTAAESQKLDEILLDGVRFWATDFAPRARAKLLQELKRRRHEGAWRCEGPLQPHDGGGRYALAEMLRCLGRFGSRAAVLRAAELAGADGEALCVGAEADWRPRFIEFVETRWLCPITSPHSPF
mmetsp:Transcript_110433/g.330306  ORF Transcript_110433/g.330306 Transcript_110433/m.330306 type:complete len:689 (+) Transcript_110433:60-2126(+)